MASTVWKDGTRRGIVYVEEKETAERVMAALAGRRGGGASPGAPPPAKRKAGAAGAAAAAEAPLGEGAMAVYLDRKGRPFAWQIPFDLGQWDRVAALVGNE